MRRRPGADADRAGPGRHAVQPAGVGRDLHARCKRAGHAGQAGLAVVGPQRLRAAARRAGHAPPRAVATGPAGAGLVQPLRPRHRAPQPAADSPTSATGSSTPPATSRRPTRRRRPTRSAHERTLYLSGASSSAGADGALVTSRAARSSPGTSVVRAASAPIGPNYTETSGLDQAQPVTDPPGHRDPVRHARR